MVFEALKHLKTLLGGSPTDQYFGKGNTKPSADFRNFQAEQAKERARNAPVTGSAEKQPGQAALTENTTLSTEQEKRRIAAIMESHAQLEMFLATRRDPVSGRVLTPEREVVLRQQLAGLKNRAA